MRDAGVIAGVVVGAVCLIALFVTVIMCCVRSHKKKREKRFARQAYALGIRNAFPLDHLDERQQRAIVVRQLSRTLPPDLSLAEAVHSAGQSLNHSFAFVDPTDPTLVRAQLPEVSDAAAPPSTTIEHASQPSSPLPGPSVVNDISDHSGLDAAARLRQPHMLELEILLPQPFQIPNLGSAESPGAVADVTARGPDRSTTEVPVSADGEGVAEPSVGSASAAPAQAPARRSSQLTRLFSRFATGSAQSPEDENTEPPAPGSANEPVEPLSLPYSPTLVVPQQRLWERYLKKKAVVGVPVADEEPPATPVYYGAHTSAYHPRGSSPPARPEACTRAPNAAEPVDPTEDKLSLRDTRSL